MEDNTHTSKQAYVRQPHPIQTTYKPHETNDRNQLDYETKVPCGAAYIIWPGKAVSLNNSACQYCTPTKPNTFSTDHAPSRNTTSYRRAATNCSTLHQRRHSQLDHFSFSLSARPVHDFYIAVITARQKLRLELRCCRLDVVGARCSWYLRKLKRR